MNSDFSAVNDDRTDRDARLAAARRLAATWPPDLTARCEIDLHCHSFCSDGYFSPAGKVFEAYRRRMKAIAISDHDLFDGQLEALEAGQIFGVEVVPAVEFYTDRPGIEIIGHFPLVEPFRKLYASGVLAEVVEPIRAAKQRQLQQMLARIPDCFRRLNFTAEITPEDIRRYIRNGISTKGDISVAMWQKYGPALAARGLAADVKDFQFRYTTKDEMLNVPLDLNLDLSPAAFVRRIRGWGGLPGFAHPTELRKKEGLGNAALAMEIDRLAPVGLQSVEVDGWRNGTCPETGRPQTAVFNELRLQWNAAHPDALPLLFTNGSDDHNQPGEGLELGGGKNRNLHPEFGRYANLLELRARQQLLLSRELA